jgi:hypothetical protein
MHMHMHMHMHVHMHVHMHGFLFCLTTNKNPGVGSITAFAARNYARRRPAVITPRAS